jgi:hypothetical protein
VPSLFLKGTSGTSAYGLWALFGRCMFMLYVAEVITTCLKGTVGLKRVLARSVRSSPVLARSPPKHVTNEQIIKICSTLSKSVQPVRFAADPLRLDSHDIGVLSDYRKFATVRSHGQYRSRSVTISTNFSAGLSLMVPHNSNNRLPPPPQ